jgi:hypothetical protein
MGVPSTFAAYCDRSKNAAPAAALFAGAFAVGLAPTADGDLWWHLAAGRQIARTGSLLWTDPFSVSAAGRPWFDVHWLFQVALYGAYCIGGLTAIVLAKCLLVAIGAVVQWVAVQREAGRRAGALFAIVFLGAMFLCRELLLVRPVIVTLVFVSLFFLLLERSRHSTIVGWSALVPLALLQIVWANCQGLFVLGPALVAAYAVGSLAEARRPVSPGVDHAPAEPETCRPRALGIALLLCVLACFITPYGVHALALPIKLFHRLMPTDGNVYAANIAENVSPFAMGRSAAAEFWHLRWFFGLLAASVFAARRRLPLAHTLLIAGLVVLALMANRNVLLLYWLATPIAVMNLGPGLRRLVAALRVRRALRRGDAAGWAFRGALAAMLAVVGAAAAREPPLASPAPFRAPVEGTQVIADRPGTGTIFAADEYGGYLIWKLFPRYRPYMDTRQVLHTPSEFAEYLALADHPERFDDFARRQAFDYVVLPVGYPDRYLDLVRHLYSSATWELVFTNGTETVFAPHRAGDGRTDGLYGWDLGSPATTDRVLAAIDRQYAASPRIRDAARLQFATLDSTLGKFEQGDRILRSMGPSAETDALGARCRLASGDLAGAQRIGERLLEKDGDDVRSLNLMAMVSLRRGDPRLALDFLRRAVSADPFDAEAGRLLSSFRSGSGEAGDLSSLEGQDNGQPHRE